MGERSEWMGVYIRNVTERADHGLQRVSREPGNIDSHREAGWRMRELVKLIEEGAMPEMTPNVQAAVERFRNEC